MRLYFPIKKTYIWYFPLWTNLTRIKSDLIFCHESLIFCFLQILDVLAILSNMMEIEIDILIILLKESR